MAVEDHLINVIQKNANGNVFFYKNAAATDANFVSYMSPLSYVDQNERKEDSLKIIDKTRGGDKRVNLQANKPYAFLDETGTPIAGLPIIPTVEELENILGTYFFFLDSDGGGPSVDTNFANTTLTLDADRLHEFAGFAMLLNAIGFTDDTNIQPAFILDTLGSVIGAPISGLKIGPLNGQYGLMGVIGDGGAGDRYQAFMSATDDSGNEHRFRVNEDGIFSTTEDGGDANRLEVTKTGINIVNELGTFVVDLPSASDLGQVLTLINGTTKEVRYQFPTPLGVYENFPLRSTSDLTFNIPNGNFYAALVTVPAGLYDSFEFYLSNINGIGAGETANLRVALYDLNGNEIDQKVLALDNTTATGQRYTLAFDPVNAQRFRNPTMCYMVVGINDQVGTITVQVPRARTLGGNLNTNEQFRFIQPTGALPADLNTVIRLVENDSIYLKIFQV